MIRQHHRRERPGAKPRHLDDLKSGKRASHERTVAARRWLATLYENAVLQQSVWHSVATMTFDPANQSYFRLETLLATVNIVKIRQP
jgi:hypothetical protein